MEQIKISNIQVVDSQCFVLQLLEDRFSLYIPAFHIFHHNFVQTAEVFLLDSINFLGYLAQIVECHGDNSIDAATRGCAASNHYLYLVLINNK